MPTSWPHRLDVATGAESKIQKLSSPTLAERDPTIQRGEIALVRRNGGRDELRIADTTSAAKGSRLLVRARSIRKPELGNRHLVYTVTSPGPTTVDGTQRMRIRNLRTGAERQIYRAVSGGANAAGVTRPSYDPAPASFVFARTNNGSGRGNRIIRYTLRGSALSYARGTPAYSSTAWVSDALGVVFATSLIGEESPGACVDAGRSFCQVGPTGPLEFDLGP